MAKEKREKRYDSQRHVLHEGEYERSPGKYVYRWREEVGRTAKGSKTYIQHAITANSLDELKEKKSQIRRDIERRCRSVAEAETRVERKHKSQL